MACGCSKSKATGYVVRVPGQAPKTVNTVEQAKASVSGIRGASYQEAKAR